MLFDGVWVVSIDPEDGIVDTVADAVGPHVIGNLHHSAHAKRFQSRVVEGGGTADVRDSNASVVNHLASSVHESLSVPTAIRPSPQKSAASRSYKATIPSTSPAVALETNNRAKS